MKLPDSSRSKKLISLLLIIATVVSIIYVPIISMGTGSESEENEAVSSAYVAIMKDGYEIKELTLNENEKITLTAYTEGCEGMKYQWQILDPADKTRWISISGANSATLNVGYALIGSMLSSSGTASLRLTMKRGDVLYSSEPVVITPSYSVPGYSELMYAEGSLPSQMADAGTDKTEELGTYTIVINYLFDDNTIAFEPYGAEVAKGSSFKESVTSPSILGYEPFRRVGEDYLSAKTVSFDIASVGENVTVNVIYEPALVEYKVHHHLQNLLDDDYSSYRDYETTHYALTGSTVPEGLEFTSSELPGFKALSYERLEVAADGSTVVEIRYDRNYRLVDFDMSGGYGTEPVYVKYGSEVGANMPTMHGYVFDGWELVSYGGRAPTAEEASKYDLNASGKIIVPDASLKYRAIWITMETTYTMVFWAENANDDGYTYLGYLDGIAAMSGSTVSAADRASEAGIGDSEHFTFNPSRSDKNVIVEGDGSTVVNAYYTRNRYKITFKSASATCAIPVGHTHGADCYTYVCTGGHVHSDECDPVLTCLSPVHTEHTDACLRCGYVEHAHGDACCTRTVHTHSTSCYANVGTKATLSGAPTNVEDGYIYRTNYRYYICINGEWYRYNGWGASAGDVIDARCGYTEHTHGSGCCELPEHAHSDVCYKDVLHTHGETCYAYSCGVSAHEHSGECGVLSCGITESHTHSTSCNRASSNTVNTIKTVYRKYQQSLNDIWPVTSDHATPTVYDDGQRWDPSDSSYYEEVLVYIAEMPGDDFTLTMSAGQNKQFTMNYYLEVLPGFEGETVSYDGKTFALSNTVKANYNHITRAEDFFEITGFTNYASDPAFSGNQITEGKDDINTVNFYYTRKTTQKLTFNNNGTVLTAKTVTGVMYGAPLKDKYFVPDYPSNLEAGAFEFKGWYTSPGCYDGTEVDWNTLTMSAGDMQLFAKWSPIIHTVKVYKTAELSADEQIGSTQLVAHNAFATTPDGAVENGDLIFLGWFYVDPDDGKEKAFVFNSIPVYSDMNIYAKWSSHVWVDYEIRYVLKDAVNGTETEIAPRTVGQTLAGNNMTFLAKAGDELNEHYRKGYYPHTNSHTVTMQAGVPHRFTFEYIYVETMPYKVIYVDESGNAVAEPKIVTDNALSVVTETFVRVAKKMPDAYQKRLVLSTTGTDADKDGVLDHNVITFRYTTDEAHAYYKVVHYIQNIAANDYREYRSTETVGSIGTVYTAEALTLTGFTFDPTKTKINGTVTAGTGSSVSYKLSAEGSLIELYYKRDDTSYTVNYVDTSGNALVPQKTVSGLFGAQIVESARDLTKMGYTIATEQSTRTITLSVNPSHNTITFTYTESIVSIKYEAVGGGSLSITSENVLAVNGTPSGSVPTASAGYRFVGWFTDRACTLPVDAQAVDSETGKLRPTKAEGTIWKDGTAYYALFVPDRVDLKIRTTGASDADKNQAFIFRIKGVDGTLTEGVDLTVAIIGNGEVTVKDVAVGKYEITELASWSWRYETDTPTRSITLQVDASANIVVFDNERTNNGWLDASATGVTVLSITD